MFGFPLTLYVVAAVLGLPGPLGGSPQHPMEFFLGPDPLATAVVVGVAFALIAPGALLVIAGWRGVYRGDGLVTTGVYGWVRHPQYLGLILITSGLLVWWPTILTIPMWPLLTWTYFRLARREEDELESEFGKAYEAYRRSVGMFLPRRREPPWERGV